MPLAPPPPDLLPVFNAMPGASLLLTPEWRIVAASDDYLAATLTQREAIVGQHIFDAFPDNPETPEANGVANVRASLTRVMTTGQPHEMALQHYDVPDRTRPGHFVERHWLPRHTPVLDAQGQVQFIIQSVQDITASRLAERQLRESQAREQTALAEAERHQAELQRVFKEAPVAMGLMRGPSFVLEWANARMGQIWGRPLEQVVGRPHFEALPDLVGQGFEQIFADVLATGRTASFQELLVRIEQAHQPYQGYFNITYQPVYDGAHHIAGILCSAIEVTEQVLARRQVEQLNQELESRVRERTQEVEKARATAEEQRNRMVRLFSQAPAQINLFQGPNHVWTMVHPSSQALLPNRTLQGLPRRQALPELPEDQHEPFDRVYRTGQPVYVFESIRRLDRYNTGEMHDEYFDVTFQPKFDAAGQVEGVMSFAVNVTERVRARQAQETERQRLLLLFQEAPAGIAILAGPDLVYEFINPRYQALLPGRALLGRPIFEAFSELVGTPVATMLQEVYATGQPHEEQAMLVPVARPTDGALEERYFSFIYQPRRNERDEVDGVLAFVFEVTEQVRARQASEASAQQLRLITDALPVLISYLDRDRRYRFANEAYRAWFKRDPAALLGQPVREVLGEAPYAATEGYMERALAGERVDFEARMPYREDFVKHIRTSYVPDVRNGQVQGFYSLVNDITDEVESRQQVERLNQRLTAINEELTATNTELQRSNHQLTRTNVDLDNFIYTASHDLRAPITNIEGLLYLLQEELPEAVTQNAEVGPTLALMLDSVERFKRTIDHLTDITKLQKENDAAPTMVNLAAVVEDVRQDLRPQLEAAGAKLFIDVSVLPPVKFSEKNLRSIVYNLVSNAVKYRHPDRTPHVDVRAHVRPDHTVLEVHDNGLGLEAHHLPRLFTMFQRFHDHVEGTGIGLYMINRMVENVGGRIEVHSQLGAGTTFFVFLPHTTNPAGHQYPEFQAS